VTSERPDPDALLRKVQDEETRAQRAKLKVFFGASPGVGKTYAMLSEARERKAMGVDVVVGVVETHGRSETAALVEGFESVPPRELPYRGIFMQEFDLEAAKRRKPHLILMDELAHTNVQGSRHEKRWQDVLDLLDAGIDVHTTLNVQHLESLRDVVAQITGIVVRENVPEPVLERAEKFDLAAMAKAIGQDVAAILGEGRIKVDAGTTPAPVSGDHVQIDQLIRNLVDNALKYGDPEEPVMVGIATDEDRVTLTVTDRGPGIAPEHLPHLTRRFYRTDPGRSRASGGTGLGLAIVKHIVERHRGTLDFASRLGEGTIVTVRFPRWTDLSQ